MMATRNQVQCRNKSTPARRKRWIEPRCRLGMCVAYSVRILPRDPAAAFQSLVSGHGFSRAANRRKKRIRASAPAPLPLRMAPYPAVILSDHSAAKGVESPP
jgi:hypothetical protein